MKIYTKKGDTGETSLLGGSRLPKHHVRIESYGTVDELNSFLGALRDHLNDQKDEKRIINIQEILFTMGSHLASDPKKTAIKIPELPSSAIDEMEKWIDEMESSLEPMKNFVLPGGHPSISACHISRSVCRRAERWITALNAEQKVDPFILQYVNRLSDFLFVLSRKMAKINGISEIPWNPR